MYNKVIMMGRIANDLELKTTPQGVSVCTFRIAVDRRYQAKGEEKKSDFFNVVAWRGHAEFVTKYFSKGRSILVEGEFQTRGYTDKNGNPATWHEIIADRLCFTGEPKPKTESAPPPVPPPVPPASPNSSAPAEVGDYPALEQTDDDYPF